MADADDRIVLPLSAVRRAVEEMDKAFDCAPGDHASWCLGPYLEKRDADMARQDEVLGVTPDCRDGKHEACTGCTCDCHRHSRRPV